jgi:hypothetical protein
MGLRVSIFDKFSLKEVENNTFLALGKGKRRSESNSGILPVDNESL